MSEAMRKELDPRNVQDYLKHLSVEEIRCRLSRQRRNFATGLINIEYDLNTSGIIRTHNNFCGQEIFYLGRKRMDRRGAVGCYIYENLTHCPTLEDFLEKTREYTLVGIEQHQDAIPLPSYRWPKRPLLLMGQEMLGLNSLPELLQHCKDLVYIPSLGSTRSLNVGVAAGIAMYDYVSKTESIGENHGRVSRFLSGLGEKLSTLVHG